MLHAGKGVAFAAGIKVDLRLSADFCQMMEEGGDSLRPLIGQRKRIVTLNFTGVQGVFGGTEIGVNGFQRYGMALLIGDAFAFNLI